MKMKMEAIPKEAPNKNKREFPQQKNKGILLENPEILKPSDMSNQRDRRKSIRDSFDCVCDEPELVRWNHGGYGYEHITYIEIDIMNSIKILSAGAILFTALRWRR